MYQINRHLLLPCLTFRILPGKVISLFFIFLFLVSSSINDAQFSVAMNVDEITRSCMSAVNNVFVEFREFLLLNTNDSNVGDIRLLHGRFGQNGLLPELCEQPNP